MKLFYALGFFGQLQNGVTATDYEAYMNEMEAKFDPEAFKDEKAFISSMNSDGTGTINFENPGRDTEDGGDPNLPNKYKCDACKILAMLMENDINDRIEKNSAVKSGEKELLESEVVDALEDLCAAALRTFKSVGIKTINKVKHVSCPGYLDTIPGITQHGQFWPQRMRQHCQKMLEEMEDEWNIYEIIRGQKGKGLKFEMCFNGANKDCVRFPTDIGPVSNKDEL